MFYFQVEALSVINKVSFIVADEPCAVVNSCSYSPAVCAQPGSRKRLIVRLGERKVIAAATPSRPECVGTKTGSYLSIFLSARRPGSRDAAVPLLAPRLLQRRDLDLNLDLSPPAVSESAVVGVYPLIRQREQECCCGSVGIGAARSSREVGQKWSRSGVGGDAESFK